MQKLLVIDFWSQYTHLITSKFRHLWIYTEIIPANNNSNLLEEKIQEINSWELKWIILSGWPDSVYDEWSLTISSKIYDLNIPILAICYGHQLTHKLCAWEVERGKTQEYGEAKMKIDLKSELFKWFKKDEITVWMSHWDEVIKLWEWFETIWNTQDCFAAATSNESKNIFTLQFHPEVTHTEKWIDILENFANITWIKKEWSMKQFLDQELKEIKERIWNKNVLLLISWWVDSTVVYFLLKTAIKPSQIYPVFVDTGFMRKNEAKLVETMLKKAGVENLQIVDARDDFIDSLKWVIEPEEKRAIIWKKFIEIQKNVIWKMDIDVKNWFLAQWTIYPDTIESWWTKNSKTIKTHHNRVPEITAMIEKWLVIEPIEKLYKDEVREVWTLLWLDENMVHRHPFPWPWLALRLLCSDWKVKDSYKSREKKINKFLSVETNNYLSSSEINGNILPVKSVWVQGDNRTYNHPLLITKPLSCPKGYTHKGINSSPSQEKEDTSDWKELFKISTDLTNNFSEINRVLLDLTNTDSSKLKLKQTELSKDRIELLQEIDSIVEKFLLEKWYQRKIWQFPVVLVPLSSDWEKEAIVLRPISSTNAMTLSPSEIDFEDLKDLVDEIMKNDKIEAVFYDLTGKPPWTVEWE